jgi:hypothetical protein
MNGYGQPGYSRLPNEGYASPPVRDIHGGYVGMPGQPGAPVAASTQAVPDMSVSLTQMRARLAALMNQRASDPYNGALATEIEALRRDVVRHGLTCYMI